MSAEGAALSSPAAGAAGSDDCEGGLDASMLCSCLCRVVSYAWILKAWWRRLQ